LRSVKIVFRFLRDILYLMEDLYYFMNLITV